LLLNPKSVVVPAHYSIKKQKKNISRPPLEKEVSNLDYSLKVIINLKDLLHMDQVEPQWGDLLFGKEIDFYAEML
jgi:hypothetical protein